MATPGKNAVLKVIAVGGGTVDLTSYLTSVSGPEPDFATTDVSTLGDTFKEFMRTQIDPGEISFEGIYDPAVGTVLFPLGTAETALGFMFYPQGTAGTPHYYSGSCFLNAFGPSADRDDAVLFSGSLKLTGTLTYGTA